MKNIFLNIFAFWALCSITGCSDFLDEKSDSRLATPVTLEDNQALMDRTFNTVLSNSISGQISTDEIYITDADYGNLTNEFEKRLYTWQPGEVSSSDENDWGSCYRRINVCNTVLYNIEHYQIASAENLKGQALALRAAIYLEAAQVYCLAYNENTANTDLGLPLRLDPDMNIPSKRSSLKETYDQIISDLKVAATLLPATQIALIRPSKATALGYLSRTYLFMGDYQNTLEYGKQTLAIHNDLIDFNTLNPSDSYPIKSMNTEVLLHSSMVYSQLLSSSMAKISQSFYNTYDNNDLRRSIYFRLNTAQQILFKGNYSGGATRMTCLATDEIYLNVAESYARLSDIPKAMQTLNELLKKRWKTGTYIPMTANSQNEALDIILKERRKELLFRGLRWSDLKRFNRDGAGISLQRIVNGTNYTLPPNDLRYAIAIPEDIIKMTGMPQNQR
ncbi:RagB/SusD family nutrient uptake outer membrane protein [Chryseobacterium flavum]|uniref:RagB/SusD family nutrient uptake outer membrane protein n=1 Tax=Chryseobacterium flavum TaxID=415851 RepID=UPI002FD9773E